jgi:glycerol transport system permease protein
MADAKESAMTVERGGLPAGGTGVVAGDRAVAGDDAVARAMRRRGENSRFWWLVPTIYILFLMLPIYWLVNMSFKTNQ